MKSDILQNARKLSNVEGIKAFGPVQADSSSREVARAFNTSRQSIDWIKQHYKASGDHVQGDPSVLVMPRIVSLSMPILGTT